MPLKTTLSDEELDSLEHLGKDFTLNMPGLSKGPYRWDIVGSFLRPALLKAARSQFLAGEISAEQLKAIEDEQIIDLIEKEKSYGLKAVTDGEFRRRWWHLDFIAGLNGITIYDFETTGFGVAMKAQGSTVSGPLSFNPDHPFLDHFRFTKEHASPMIAKQTIPGPNMILLDAVILSKPYHEHPAYADFEGLKADLITTYQQAIEAFYQAGCRYLQLDDTSWGALFDERFNQLIIANGFDPEQLITTFKEITEAAIAHKPNDMTLTFHMCRGNFRSHWLYSGDYARISKQLFSLAKIDGFFLEYDDERSGSFEPLLDLGKQKIVLGLITTKTGELESVETLTQRVKQASRYVDFSQLCISPQCGFASTEDGNVLSEDEQWAKVNLLVTSGHQIFDR